MKNLLLVVGLVFVQMASAQDSVPLERGLLKMHSPRLQALNDSNVLLDTHDFLTQSEEDPQQCRLSRHGCQPHYERAQLNFQFSELSPQGKSHIRNQDQPIHVGDFKCTLEVYRFSEGEAFRIYNIVDFETRRLKLNDIRHFVDDRRLGPSVSMVRVYSFELGNRDDRHVNILCRKEIATPEIQICYDQEQEEDQFRRCTQKTYGSEISQFKNTNTLDTLNNTMIAFFNDVRSNSRQIVTYGGVELRRQSGLRLKDEQYVGQY